MSGKYLTPEQEAQFREDLNSEKGLLTPEAQEEAVRQGAEMARADAMQKEAQILEKTGFGTTEELVKAYQEERARSSQLKEAVDDYGAMFNATRNALQLDPNAPDAHIRAVIAQEMEPLYRREREKEQFNRAAEKWRADAEGMPDLAELMPEIQEYLVEHAALSVDEDGLQRAYDAVRSKKYKTEDMLTSDPEFLKRMAGNEQIRKMVIEDHLQQIARNGEAVPQTITDGGSIPMTAKKNVSGMEQAKQKLLSMLGGN